MRTKTIAKHIPGSSGFAPRPRSFCLVATKKERDKGQLEALDRRCRAPDLALQLYSVERCTSGTTSQLGLMV